MSPYLANFWQGIRIALFRRVRVAEFRADWTAFWIGLSVMLVIDMAASFAAAEPPVYFNVDAFQYLGLTCMGYLLCGFAGALLLKRSDLQQQVPVLVLYAGLLPLLVYAVFYEALRMPWWAETEDLWAFYGVFLAWLFLAGFRALDLCVPDYAVVRQYVLAALAVGVIAGPPYVMYIDSFFETDYSSYERDSPYDDLNTENLLQGQHRVLKDKLDALGPAKKGRMDAFVVTFGAYGSQDVFMKEARLARDVFGTFFGNKAHAMALINNPETAKEGDQPLATSTNLRDTLVHMAGLAQTDEDMIVLYMTSHGYRGGTLSVDMGPIRLNKIAPELLREILDESGFKWRVVVVSACYSGGMVDALKDDNTIIMTAAAPDKTSFGCSDDADLTYFGRALLEDALPDSPDLLVAFEKARDVVTAREAEEGIPSSNPQIYIGTSIRKKLSEK